MNRAAFLLDAVSMRIGIAVAWLGIPLMLLSGAAEPVARWIGWSNNAPFGETSTVAFLAVTMTSFGYAYAAGAHVRLDVLSRRFPPRLTAVVELVGTLAILLPLCALIVIDGLDSAWRSFELRETWSDTAWPLQWVVRIWIPLGFALLIVAGAASALRALASMFRK